jgi:hypothetical protein
LNALENVRTLANAEQACSDGLLRKVLLLPVELGGSEVSENIVFVPDHAAAIKEEATSALVSAVRQGMVEVSVVPEYRGTSFVPTRIVMTAARIGQSPEYVREIGIW